MSKHNNRVHRDIVVLLWMQRAITQEKKSSFHRPLRPLLYVESALDLAVYGAKHSLNGRMN